MGLSCTAPDPPLILLPMLCIEELIGVLNGRDVEENRISELSSSSRRA